MELVAIDTDRELLPEEELLDSDHPANDQYMIKLAASRRRILAHTRTMRPRHVAAIKRVHTGEPNTTIAESLGVTPQTITQIKKSLKGQQLLALLAHYACAIEGPNEQQRRNMLWRIASAHEQIEPKTSIQAVAEINRMTMAEYKLANDPHKSAGQPLQIIINQQQLPRTQLDQ